MPLPHAELTGREEELGVLRRVARAAAAGAGGAVLLLGEAGIGKTALVDATVAAGAVAPLRVLRGRAWEEGGAPPYWPWREVADAGGWDLRWEGDDQVALFADVVAALRRAAAEQPLLVTIDDLHAADEGSVRLSRFVARVVGELPVAVVLAGRPSARLDALHGDVDVVVLGALADDEAGALVDSCAPAALAEEVRADLVARAEGNPLFLRELARSAAVDGDELPAGVLAAVARRVGALPAATATAVRAAAVLGREVDPADVAALCGLAPAEALDVLQPAADVGLLVPQQSGRWRFGHDLVREAAEAGLPVAGRAALHAAAARLTRGGSAAVARHLLAAVPAVPAEQAVAAAGRAADESVAARSLGEAVSLLQRALPLLDDEPSRLAWLLRLGALALDDGQVAVSQQAFDEAVRLARRVDRPRDLAAAALGRTERLMTETSITDHLPLLEEARRRCQAADGDCTDEVVRLGARRARLLAWSDPSGARAAAEDAVALAAGRPADVRYDALAALHVTCWGAGGLHRASEVSTAMVEAAVSTGDPERQVEAWIARLVDDLRVGDVSGADEDLAALVRVADASGRPRHRYFALSRLATRAFLAGQVSEGERLSELARRLGEQIEEPDTVQVFHGSRVCALAHLYDRQELAEVAHWFDTTIAVVAPEAGWFGAAIHAALGDGATAVAAVRRSVAVVPDSFAPGRLPLMELALSVSAAVVAEDRALAADLERALRPWSGQVAVNQGAVTVGGLVDHHLGRLAALLGRPEEARQLLAAAVEGYRAMGAALWLGEAEAQLAGLPPPAATEVRPETSTAAADGREAHVAGAGRRAVLRRARAGWEVGFEGATAVVPDARGLQHLSVLLASPGRDVAAVALVSPESAPVAVAEARHALLDDTAKAAYRARIGELRAALDDADAVADPEASGRAQAELDALVGELRRAVGLGGRDRVAGSAEERARVAVRKAVTATLDRLADHDPRFAHLLRRDVRTGRLCRYEPDPDAPVSWALA